MRYIFYILIVLTSLSSLRSQNLEHTTLWKIEGNELDKPSYLFGTIHVTCDASLEPKVMAALDSTEQLVLELDMDDPQLQVEVMQGMMMKDGVKISDLISDEEFKILDEFLKRELGAGLAVMNSMKPFFIQATLYPALLDCEVKSFETELVKVSQAQNEEVLGLETVTEQMNVFDVIPYEDQLKDLLKMAKDSMISDKQTLKKLTEAYNNQNIESMITMMEEDDSNMVAGNRDALVNNRNKNWISRMEGYAIEKPTFFGVGAAHLAGKEGVIKLLRAEGYQVTPVF